MKTEVIKDYYTGRVQGYLEEQANGDIWAYDWRKRLMGKYIKSLNVTRDWRGVPVSKGNTVAALIPKE